MKKRTRLRFDVEGFIDDRIGITHVAHGKHGEEYVCNCPFCGSAGKFWCNAKTGVWTCYKCGEAGGILRLVEIIDDVTPIEARQIVAGDDRGRIATPVGELVAKVRTLVADRIDPVTEAGAIALPDEFIPIWNEADQTWRIPAYLEDRKISPRIAMAFGLGFCLEGPYHHRIILPSRMDGLVRMWQGRAMGPFSPKYHGPAAGKGQALFGFDEAIGAEEVLVVEGPFDSLNCSQKGFPAVAAMGRTISRAQAMALRRGGFRRAIVMWDPPEKDGAGNEADPESAANLLGEILDDVRVAIPVGDHDPGDASPEEIEAAVAAARGPSLLARIVRGGR